MKKQINNLEVFLRLTKRHVLVFTRNKIRMFYTLLAPIVILLVYIIFLRRLEIDSISKTISNVPIEVLTLMVDSWFLSGTVALCTISISIQTNNIIVNDKENGTNRDFASSPISRTVVTLSYIAFNFVVTLLMCIVYVLITFVFLAIAKEWTFNFIDVLLIFAMVAFISLLAAAFTTFLCSFISKEGTLASIIGIISAALGFLIGTFMPIALFPKWLQDICFFIPGFQSTGLMRFVYMNAPLLKYQELLGSNYQILINQVGYNIVFYTRDIASSIDLTIDPVLQGGTIISPAIQTIINSGYILIFSGINLLTRKNMIKTNIK